MSLLQCSMVLIAQARFWFEQLASGEAASVRAIAQRENIYETEVRFGPMYAVGIKKQRSAQMRARMQ